MNMNFEPGVGQWWDNSMCGCGDDVQICRCLGVQMRGCADVRMIFSSFQPLCHLDVGEIFYAVQADCAGGTVSSIRFLPRTFLRQAGLGRNDKFIFLGDFGDNAKIAESPHIRTPRAPKLQRRSIN